MANRVLAVYESGALKGRASNAETVDFLSIKIGATGMEIKETSSHFDFSGKKLTNIVDGAAATDAATYGQLQTVATQGKLWKEAILSSSQLLNGASGGIYGANVIKLTSNFTDGDTITLNDGSANEVYTAGDGTLGTFDKGATINAALTALSAAINLGAIAVSSTTAALTSLDASNNVLVLWQDTIGQPTRIYSTTGTPGIAQMLPVAKCYDGLLADLVSVPTADPAATNFGFSRAKSALATQETHQCRVDDVTYSWDNDAELWNNTGSSSVPVATKVLAGKVQVGDGIAVAAGVISAAVDTTTIELSGTSPNKTLNVKSGVYSLAGHDHSGVYLPIAGTAADSSKLNGQSASFYATASDVSTISGNYVKKDTDSSLATGVTIAVHADTTFTTYDLVSKKYVDDTIAPTKSYTNDNASTISIRQVVYVKANGNVDLAVASSSLADAELGLVADATILTTAAGLITVKDGAIIGSFSGLIPGKKYFVDPTTPGAITDTAPSATGQSVYIVGRAVSTTELKYKPVHVIDIA